MWVILFIYSFFVELHLSRWNKWFTNHTQSANYTGKNGLWRFQLAEFAGFRPDFQHRHVGLGPRLNHPKGRTGCLLHLMINTALFYRGVLQFIRLTYLFIYLFRNRVPSVPRNRRGSCSVLADRAFWASLKTARIWVYSALIIKCTIQKENRLGGKVLTSASVVGSSSRPVAQEIFHLHVDGWPRARVHAWCLRTEPTHAQT